jgi:hypothetical protein
MQFNESKKIIFKYSSRSIIIDDEPLNPKLDIGKRFEWGLDSQDSRLTAFHILNHYAEASIAYSKHIQFTQEIVVNIPRRDCKIDESIIRKWVVRHCQRLGKY